MAMSGRTRRLWPVAAAGVIGGHDQVWQQQ
jgi:hypothetical protein